MLIEERVKLVKDEEFTWDWDSSNPSFNTKTANVSYGSTTRFDPFPCYHHDLNRVIECAKKVEERFPIQFPVFYFIFPYEPIARTNGQAHVNTIKYGKNGEEQEWDGVIELYGKRIPLSPFMTRYLVAHEYGHIVDTWICARRGLPYNGIDEEYAKMRGIDVNQKYGGRKWHTNIGEIIANDFRIAVCNAEPEFWPHEVAHPKDCPQVHDYWYRMMLEHGNS